MVPQKPHVFQDVEYLIYKWPQMESITFALYNNAATCIIGHTNFALFRPSTQSSKLNCGGWEAGRAVDSDISPQLPGEIPNQPWGWGY